MDDEVECERDDDLEECNSIKDQNKVNINASVSTHSDSLAISLKFELFYQIEIMYNNLARTLEERKFYDYQSIETWFKLMSNEILFIEEIFKEESSFFYFQIMIEIISFGLIFLQNNLNEQLAHSFKNALFYLHQNSMILRFILVHKAENCENVFY